MQEENPIISDFVRRTDALSLHLRIPLSEVAKVMDVNPDMLMGYRTGRYKISSKALAKLARAEEGSGFNVAYLRDPDRFAAPLKLASEIAKKLQVELDLDKETEQMVFQVVERILTPALLPSDQDSQRREAADAANIKIIEVREKLEGLLESLKESNIK